jgi:hypothetical protein
MTAIRKKSGEVIFSYDHPDIKYTLERAVSCNKDLWGANLARADLAGAYMTKGQFIGADFEGAELGGADLSRSCLKCANFNGANLKGANLREACLGWGSFSGADLSGADLSGADLSSTDFSAADLTEVIFESEVQTLEYIEIRPWSILKAKSSVIVGWHHLSREEWAIFDETEIDEMEDGILDFWRKYKEIILS